MSSAKKTEAQQLNNKHQVSTLPHLCGITYWNLYDLPLLECVLTTVEDWFSVRMFVVLLRFQKVSCRSVSVGFSGKTSVFGSV